MAAVNETTEICTATPIEFFSLVSRINQERVKKREEIRSLPDHFARCEENDLVSAMTSLQEQVWFKSANKERRKVWGYELKARVTGEKFSYELPTKYLPVMIGFAAVGALLGWGIARLFAQKEISGIFGLLGAGTVGTIGTYFLDKHMKNLETNRYEQEIKVLFS